MDADLRHAARVIVSRYPATLAGLSAAVASPEWQAEPLLREAQIEGPPFYRLVWPSGMTVDVVSVDTSPSVTYVWPTGRGLDEPPDRLLV